MTRATDEQRDLRFLEPANSNRWRILSSILDEALERPRFDRESFVREACKDNDALCREALEFLQACEKPTPRLAFLDTPAAEHFAGFLQPDGSPRDEAPLSDLSGSMAGDQYCLTRRIGRGGMAEVYLAEDLKHHRPVAIKVMYPDFATAVGVESFLREITFAARLGHPHIVPLFNSGEIAGRPFYAMQYVAGATLRHRLEERGRLSIEETLSIAANVADALDHAHSAGIVHLDIKPENILLLGSGHALVADFGVARAFAMAGAAVENGAPLAIGTPLYMSPEQTWGDEQVNGRSDVYSLACVVYEALAGEPPFRGATSMAVITEQRESPPPLLGEERPELARCDPVLRIALAKSPTQRFATATDFVKALRASSETPRKHGTSRAVLSAAAIVVVGALGVLAWQISHQTRVAPSLPGQSVADSTHPMVDTTKYVVLPFVRDSGVILHLDERQRLGDALRRWRDVSVVNELSLDEILARRRSGPLTISEARAIAVALKAGRFLWGDTRPIADDIRLHAVLYDVAGDSVIRQLVVRLPTRLDRVDSTLDDFTERLLFPAVSFGGHDLARGATSSFLAMQAFRAGMNAIMEWDLARADSLLTTATTADPAFSLAHLWLALARSWSAQPLASWQSSARLAQVGQGRLTERERLLAEAVLASSRDTTGWMCPKWERLVSRYDDDFAAWYGLATCLRRDTVVVPDASSPSRWRYRSSYNRMLAAYRHAYELWPSIHRGLRSHSFGEVRSLFVTSRAVVRPGHALPPSKLAFYGFAAWNDSLLFIPFPADSIFPGSSSTRLQSADEAVKHQRALFREVATSWVSKYPTSVAALEALALSLEMLGDPGALDTLHRARVLAATPGERIRVAAQEIWLRVKFALPEDTIGLRKARSLADSLLAAIPDTSTLEPGLIASIAALTGHVGRAAHANRDDALASARSTPAAIARPANELLVYSLLGGSADTLRALVAKTSGAIDEIIAAPEQTRARLSWLARPSTLAFPDHRFPALPAIVGQGYPLVDAQASLTKGDTTAAIDLVMRLSVARATVRPSDLAIDALYPEAALLDELGHARDARERLDPTLRTLTASPPQVFADAVRAGSLMRAMALRADLAAREGDWPTARAWARAVEILWSNCDPSVANVLRRMRNLARH